MTEESNGKQIVYTTALLTLAFVVLKAAGWVDWSWWFVFSPVIVVVAALLSIFLYFMYFIRWMGRGER